VASRLIHDPTQSLDAIDAHVVEEQLPHPSFHDERRYGFGLAIGLAPVVV
jgi:hypothetical protein